MREIAIVTGGSKGIGKSILKKFAQEDMILVTCARNADDLVGLKKEFSQDFPGTELHTITADLSDREEVKHFIAEVNKIKGTAKVLVNNTGAFIPGQVTNEEEGVLEKTIETNLYSAYHITRGFVHDMIEGNDGHIFNICSTASIMPYINGGSYCISKFAMLGMSKVLREELKEHNVRVTSVMPGATYTSSWESSGLPEERFMKSDDVAETVYQAWKLSKLTVIEELILRPQLGDIGEN